MEKLLISLIEFYQTYLSFDKGVLAIFASGGACRYNVRCSEYAKTKVMEFGVLKGNLLALKRIWNCR